MKKRKRPNRKLEFLSTGRKWVGYVVAVVGTALAVLLHWSLHTFANYQHFYLSFFPPVIAAALVGGTGPGLLATVLCVLAGDLLSTPPVGHFTIATVGGAVDLIVFAAICVGFSLIGGAFRRKSLALRQSQAWLHLTHHVTQIGSFEWNLETGVNSWTPELEAMYGLKLGQFPRTEPAWEALLHPEDLPKAVASVERALKTFRTEEGEWRVVWPDGTVHWLIGRFQALPNRAGKPMKLVGVHIDITHRKKAEVALHEREEWFRTMADSFPQLAWIAQPDGNSIWFNRRCYEFTGATPQQMEGWGWESVINPKVLPRVLEKWRQSIATGEPYYDTEFSLRAADGTFRSFLARVVPLKDHEGRVELWFGTATDIQELREREWALGRQARLIDLAPAAILVQKPDGTITFWSQGAERLYGWTKEEALGRHASELLRTVFPEPRKSIISKLHGGDIWSGELRHYTRDNRQVIVESYWFVERNAQGEMEELLESNTDITERKRLQEHLQDEVEARTAKLREAVAELEHMSYSMVHDMRAPLRAMHGFASLVEEECPECTKSLAADYLHSIRESSSRLDRLITDALNYNRMVCEERQMAPVEISRLLRGMIRSYPNLQPRVADITLDFEELWVLGNESLLTQCFGNLLDNAVKFTAPGIRPRVRIWAGTSTIDNQPSTIVYIEDNGIGIPKYAQENIFLMFQRMHKGSEYPGTGIGLAIVKKAVERMNGRLGLESEPARGSTFWIELPTVEAKSVVRS